MQYTFVAHNVELGERTREKVSAKLDRIQKLFPPESVAAVVISSAPQTFEVEVTIPVNRRILRAEVSDADLMAAVDKAVDKLEGQIVKYKQRMHGRSRKNAALLPEYEAIPGFIDEEEPDEAPRIVKSKQFELKPMDAEEAAMQMELLGHSFFVFRNGDTDAVNVIYKRKDGAYGLIEAL